jgi:predicted metal-binding membrane protein
MAVPTPQLSLGRQQILLLCGLTFLTAVSWGVLIWQSSGMSDVSMGLTMGMNAALFLAIWVAMMAAMMFPASAPMILTFARVQAGRQRQGQPGVSIWLFVAVYLALWGLVGVLAYLAAILAQDVGSSISWIGENGPRFGGLLLLGAGIYQLTPLKRVCLARCRSPLAFILTSWRDGVGGAVRMGVTHALYCIGCCWLLFAILFPLGMMNIALLAVITLVIFAEKTLPGGDRLAWVAAGVLIIYGAAVMISPGLLPLQPPTRTMM